MFILVCEYFVHAECVELSVPNCKECATYFPGRELSSVRHIHHWREGNLVPNSKCAVCKKTCWSSECLAGYRLETVRLLAVSQSEFQQSWDLWINLGVSGVALLPMLAVISHWAQNAILACLSPFIYLRMQYPFLELRSQWRPSLALPQGISKKKPCLENLLAVSYLII